MDNALAKQTDISMDDLRALVVAQSTKQPTDHEMIVFKRLCESLGANPFLKDIHIVKYSDGSPASFITGKDYYTKVARSQGATWEAGIIVIRNGELVKQVGSFSLPTDELVGGWANVHTKEGKTMPMEISLDEYDNKQSTWNKLKKTMIRKVALVHALRETYPEKLGGVYDSTEMQQASQFKDVDLVDTIENMDKGLPEPQESKPPVVESKPKPTSQQVIKTPVTLEDYPNVVLGKEVTASTPAVNTPQTTYNPVSKSKPSISMPVTPDEFMCPLHGKAFTKRDGKFGIYWSHPEEGYGASGWCNLNDENFKPEFIDAWSQLIETNHGYDVAAMCRAEASAATENKEDKGKNIGWWLDKIEFGEQFNVCSIVGCEARADIEVNGSPSCLVHESELLDG